MGNACLGTDTLVDFIEGRADAALRSRIEEHASRCEACREVLSSLARTSAPAVTPARPAPPTRVGRYVIERELGRGGMGIVYAAHDAELARTVAVKLLRSDGPGMQERLRREAQAMAQLAHPNVVAVHDVGTFDDQIFVAMEYVAGQTLARWETGTRTCREILAAYHAAGLGLAAAHAAGIVHRDFKPENVLIGEDGRVRVVDFGLARSAGGFVESVATARSRPDQPVSPDAPTTPVGLTEAGAMVGTPYYMAPELYRGIEADARSDQFSFCVALFTVLHGTRPFDAEAASTVVGKALARPSPRVRGGLRVPRRVQAAVRRGLAADPADRFATMDELLVAIAPTSRRWTWIALSAAGAATASAAIVMTLGGAAPASCDGAADHLRGVWDPAHQAAVAARLRGTGVPYAEATWREVDRTLDRYADDWQAMHVGACEATRVRGEQSEELLDLRMTCLDQRLHGLAGLVDTLEAADRSVTEHAIAAAHELPPIAGCADLVALRSPVRPPSAAARWQVDQLRRQLATLTARRDAGLYIPTLAAARALAGQATALGYRPLEAEVLALVGQLEVDLDDYAPARGSYERAVLAAEAGRDDAQVAHSLISLVAIIGRSLGKSAEAAPVRERAGALLERIDHPPSLEAKLLEEVGANEIAAGDLTGAERDLRAALATRERLHGPDDLHLVPALNALAHLELQREHGGIARGYLDRSLAIQRRIYGDDHPEVARTFELIAGAEYSIAHYDEAVVLYQRAQAIYDRSVAPDSLSAANVLSNLGNVYMWQGKTKEAIALDRRAIAIATARLGASHPLTLSYQTTLAQALDTDEQQPEARALLEHVLAEQRVQLGTHQATAMTLEALANLELGLHRYAAARDHALEANAMFRQVLGEGYQSHAELRTLGDAYLGLGEPARAADVLEEARRHAEPSVDPGTIAWLDSLLGRALIEAGRDRVRGKALVLSAWAHVVQDDRMLDERATLRAWMTRHGITPP